MKKIMILLLIIMNTGCDQISKNIARKNIEPFEKIDIIGKHLVLFRVENTGAFMSSGESMNDLAKIVLLAILPLLLLGYGVYYLMMQKKLSKLLVFGMSFMIGGGLGNLYDRFLHGSVTDFLHVNFFFIRSGIFNFADISIMTGMLLILISLYYKYKPNSIDENSQVG